LIDLVSQLFRITQDHGSRLVGLSLAFVCLSVRLFRSTKSHKSDAARITELGIEMFHDESWKHLFWGQR